MKSLTTLTNLYTNLSQNTSTANSALGQQLMSDQHRYLIQKYFDNERTVTTTTVGSALLTLTGSLLAGATTATLTVAWTHPTGSQLVNFSDQEQRTVLFTNGSAAISWSGGLTGAVTSAISTYGFQAYNIPANISKIKNDTINVGQLRFVPAPIQTRGEWDLINFLPYNSDIPNYYFIYNGQLLIWPIPSTTGNIITFNYKARVPDLNIADYSTGTLSGIVAGSTSITGVGTTWSSVAPLNTDLSYLNIQIRITPPSGDGIWYPVSMFTSDTTLVLGVPIVIAPSATATAYTIGQLPLLSEDFHDMLVYGAMMTYNSSVKKDAEQFKLFEVMYKERLALLEDYAGTKSVNVDLGAQPLLTNPNLFPMGI